MSDFTVKEYIVKTKDGKFKVWQEGELVDYQKWLVDKASKVELGPSTTTIIDTGMEEPVLAPPPPQLFFEQPIIPPKQYSLEKIVQKLVDKFVLQLDQESKQRFGRLLFSFFRGIRQAVDLRNNLQQDLGSSGVGLSAELVDKLMPVIKEIRQKIEVNSGEVVSVDIQEGKFRQESEVQTEIAKTKQETKDEIVAKVDRQAWQAGQPKAIDRSSLADLGKADAGEEYIVKEQPLVTPKPKLFSWHKRSQVVPASKVAMDEVRRFTKLVGPIDELRQLNLDVFRRLGPTSSDITYKIEQRISKLSEGSLAERDKAVKAWQSSPVYNLYVKLGRQSLESGLPVETVIKQQLATGQDTLKNEEFEVISDLNSKLRF